MEFSAIDVNAIKSKYMNNTPNIKALTHEDLQYSLIEVDKSCKYFQYVELTIEWNQGHIVRIYDYLGFELRKIFNKYMLTEELAKMLAYIIIEEDCLV